MHQYCFVVITIRYLLSVCCTTFTPYFSNAPRVVLYIIFYQLSNNIENTSELINYLQGRERVQDNAKVKASILRGGVSNRTVLLDLENGESWVLKQALTKLRVKGEWISSPKRIFKEAEAMRWFEKYAPPNTVPKLIFEDQKNYVLAMEAVKPPFDNLKDLLLTNPPESIHFNQAGELLGHIHQNAFKQTKDIPALFLDNHFFKTLRIEPYYIETVKNLPETTTFFNDLISETLRDQYTLVHGDYSPKNILVKDSKLILLDHEVIHFGDGTFDLGFFICHLLSKANHLPTFHKKFTDGIAGFYKSYTRIFDKSDETRERRAVKHVIGCLLARVCGLSALEYLTSEQQNKQKIIGLKLIKEQPRSIKELIINFNRHINAQN